MGSPGPMGAPQLPNQQPDPQAPGQNVIAPPGIVGGALGVEGPPAVAGQPSNNVLQPPTWAGSILDSPPNFVDTPVMLTQPGADQTQTAQPPAPVDKAPQVQFDEPQAVNAPADANKLPGGNVKDAVDALCRAGAFPTLEKDDNAAQVGEIAKNTLSDAAAGFLKEGPEGAIREGGMTLLKEGAPWLGDKYIQDLKENKLLPHLEANYAPGIQDAAAVWAGVEPPPHQMHDFNPAGDLYGASYSIGEKALGNLTPEAAGNLKAVLQDAGNRMNFNNSLYQRLTIELSARASQILK